MALCKATGTSNSSNQQAGTALSLLLVTKTARKLSLLDFDNVGVDEMKTRIGVIYC